MATTTTSAPAGGDLSGSYPDPTIAAPPAPTAVAANPQTATDPCEEPAPQTGVYCGTASRRWGAFVSSIAGSAGITFWRDRLGAIHIHGAARVSIGNINSGELLFRLPEGARPVTVKTFAIALGFSAGTPDPVGALLVINPDGRVGIFYDAPPRDQAHVGDVQFRTDT